MHSYCRRGVGDLPKGVVGRNNCASFTVVRFSPMLCNLWHSGGVPDRFLPVLLKPFEPKLKRSDIKTNRRGFKAVAFAFRVVGARMKPEKTKSR